MKKIFNFLFYPYGKKKLFSQTLLLVFLLRVGLWLFPYEKLVKWITYFDNSNLKSREPNWEIIENVTGTVRICAKYIPSATCLTQALASQFLLRRKGQDAELKFGVKIDPDKKFSAHAWLEKNGTIIIGRLKDHQDFTDLKNNSYVVL